MSRVRASARSRSGLVHGRSSSQVAASIRAGLERLGHGGVDELVLGREHPEDRALGDPGGLGDQPGRDVPAVLVEQRQGDGDQRLPPLLRRHRPRPLPSPHVHAGESK